MTYTNTPTPSFALTCIPSSTKPLRMVIAAALCSVALGAWAQEENLTISIKDHQFTPATLQVPAGKKFKLTVKNLDATPEEFESDDLHREKLIPAGKEIVINLGPLKVGTYQFKGEFNPTKAQGSLVAK